MVFIVLYPAVALLAMFIVGVIIIILRFGPVLCGLRHTALPDIQEWEDGKTYDQRVSFA